MTHNKSNLFCEKCGSTFPIMRQKGYGREKGHVKHVWCIKCKEVTAHLEALDRPVGGDLFKIEPR